MSRGLDVTVASDGERDDLFAEIWWGDTQIAELANDPARGVLVATLFCRPPSGGAVEFDLAELQEALEEGKRRLARLGYPEQKKSR